MNAAFDYPRKHRLTRRDYYRMAEIGILAREARVELIDGEIIEMAPIGHDHARIVNELNALLVHAVGNRAIVTVQNPVTLDNFSEPQPDLGVVTPESGRYQGRKTHPAGTDIHLVVEVAHSSWQYDRRVKVPLYARLGVPAVWIIRVENGELWTFGELSDGEYQSVARVEDLSRVTVGTLSECEVDLSDVILQTN